MGIKEWRKDTQEEFQTPDGLTIVCRRASLVDLAAGGQIPAPLLATVQLLEQQRKDDKGMDYSKLPEFGRLLNIVCLAAIKHVFIKDDENKELVNVSESPSDDTIGITEIDHQTRIQIFRWTNGEAASLEKFRSESESNANVAQSGNDIQHKTVKSPGN